MDNNGTYLAFDVGTKRIGVAVGQSITGTARPLTQLLIDAIKREPDWAHLKKLIQDWKPNALIVGLPLNMDETPSSMVKVAKRFARLLEEHYGLSVHLIDERLSTREAKQRLHERDEHKRHSVAEVNAMAAVVILETWFSTFSPKN